MPHMDESSYASCDGTIDLATLWRGLRSGELYIASSHYGSGRCWAVIEVGKRAVVPTAAAMDVLERVLSGAAQKVLAYELGRAFATIAGYCSQAMKAIAHEHNSARA